MVILSKKEEQRGDLKGNMTNGEVNPPQKFCKTGDADQISEIEIGFEIKIDPKAI